MKKTDI